MRRTVRLDYWKAQKHIWDYKDYMTKYDCSDNGYRLLIGAPRIINIKGHYIEINKLPDVCVDRKSKFIVSEAITRNNLGNLNFEWQI